jgi:hypothetical protein
MHNSLKEIGAPMFRESEMGRCVCCTPSKRTLATLDPAGREQFTCPETRITMRFSVGAQTFLPGHIVLR